MNFSKIKYNDLLVFCAGDKSLCWAAVVSGPQVMSLKDFAHDNGYAHYFGRTSTGNYYGVIDDAVRILHEGEPHTVAGQYQFGDYVMNGVFCCTDLDEPAEPAEPIAVVDEPAVAPAVEQPSDVPEEEDPAVEEQPAPSEPAQDEPASEEEDVSQPDYKALYDDLVQQYNDVNEKLVNIQKAFDVIKQLLS